MNQQQIEKRVSLARTMAAIGFYGAAAALLLPATESAMAQDQKVEEPKSEVPKEAPRPPRIDFYLKLSADDLQTLNAALVELPKRVADPFIAKLNGQLAVQTQRDNEAAAKSGGVK